MTLPPGRSRLLRRHFLAPTERVLLEMHPSKWWYFPGPCLLGLLLVLPLDYLVLARLFGGLPALPWLSAHLASAAASHPVDWTVGLGGAALLLTAFWLGWLIYRTVQWAEQTYAVTDERIIQQTGLVLHVIQDIPVRQIRDVNVYQRRLGAWLLRYGNLRFKSLSEVDAPDYLLRSDEMKAVSGQPSRQPDGRALPKSQFDLLERMFDPRDPTARASGVEWWVGVPDPFRIERTVEAATRSASVPAGYSPPVR